MVPDRARPGHAQEGAGEFAGRVCQGRHLRPDDEVLKAFWPAALAADDRALAGVIARAAGADGILWCGSGDRFIRHFAIRPAPRDWLEERGWELLRALREAKGFTGGPSCAEIDGDEEDGYAPPGEPPAFHEVRAVACGERVDGGFLLYLSARCSGLDEILDAAVCAFAIALRIGALQKRLADASDLLGEVAEVGRIFARVGDPERTLSRILDLAIRSAAAQTGAIVLRELDGSVSAIGMKIEQMRSVRFADGGDLVDRACGDEGERVYDGRVLRSSLAPGTRAVTLETLATFPLVHEGRSRGGLVLFNIPEETSGDAPIVAMLATIARLAAAAITGEERQRERLEEERTRQELKAARTIQQSLIPRVLPENARLAISALWKPSRTLGGDFYDLFPLSGGRIGVVIADVSGKGLAAALLMAVTRSYLRVLAEEDRPPGEVLARVNARLAGEIADSRFVTAAYLVVDPEKGECFVANAGHHPAVLIGGGAPPVFLEAEGLPLGIFPGETYTEVRHAFPEGRTMLLYTDGLLENRNDRGEFLGKAGLVSMLEAAAGSPPSALLETIWNQTLAFGGRSEPEDDWTAVAIVHHGGG